MTIIIHFVYFHHNSFNSFFQLIVTCCRRFGEL